MTDVLTGDPMAWRLPDHVGTAVAIGVFDGVHRGHRTVLDRMVALADEHGWTPTALTFDPHPLEVVAPERAPRRLSSVGQRIAALSAAGMEIVGVLAFETIREMDADTFGTDVLAHRLRARLVAIGSDFRFGHDRSGTVETLRRAGVDAGYDVMAVDLVSENGSTPISSTRIRSLLAAGDVEGAAVLLGHRYELSGLVVEGDKRGRSLGFPTANLAVDDRVAIPGDGVYAAWALIHEEPHLAVVNIGVRPTFDGRRRCIEAHLLDFDGDLYGRGMALRFVARLRGEQKFAGIDDLVSQIQTDVNQARAALEGDR